ncbi:fusion of domains from two conserved hypothetical proteins (plasmid) [Aromatoleum aromaticum EbN1]|jgi:uncharacterized protein YggL (DUF469 family)|uniref:DUF469 family protein n=1 Tax=Aromatoleum aromaticum (strain DSM 19018 / LMG 30748 / EbN1) TaxID=76114 RepID=Q5NX72_AROAE|nr:fusion of domains from two conserved hypothetical proteins [Aromatoleum aromaticum EbN1]
MTKNYRSEALGAIHETMEALSEIGAVDERTMREFDEACLTSVEALSPDEIRALRELGFQLKVQLKEGNDEPAFDALIDDLIVFIEARGLLMGGFGNPSELWHESLICAAGRGSASDEDRFAVRKWLSGHPAVEEVQTGALVDAWYGWETED